MAGGRTFHPGSYRVQAFLLVGFLLFTTLGVGLQHRIIVLEKQGEHPYRLLYLPSKGYIKPAALDYDHTLADFLFIRVIQAFGATYAQSIDLSQLWAYFDTITDLDPHFLSPYSFGNLVLGEMAKDEEKGLAILDKGIGNNPEKYKPAYDAAFYAFWGLEDVDLARTYVQVALQAPDCPDFVRRWEGFLDEKMGRYEAAFQKFLGEYVRSLRHGETVLQDVQHRRLRMSLDQWYRSELREKALEFQALEGRLPEVAELEATGAFRDVRWPDWALVRDLMDALKSGELEFGFEESEIAELSQKFVRSGWERMPPSPMSLNPHFPGYVIWKGQEPFFPDNSPNPHFVKNEFEAACMVREYLRIANQRIDTYRMENEGRCPPDIHIPFPFVDRVTDPFGGEFVLDTERCRVVVTSRPDLVAQIGNDMPHR